MSIAHLSPAFQLRDILVAHVGVGLVRFYACECGESLSLTYGPFQLVHTIFKRWEPSNIVLIFSLLLFPPLPLAQLLRPHEATTLHAIIASWCVFISTLSVSIVAYRLSPFHPLARYPGPLACKISKWWMVWQTKNGRQHKWHQEMHNKYGDAVRTGMLYSLTHEHMLRLDDMYRS